MLKLSRPGAMSNNYKEQNDIAISPEITKVVQKLKQIVFQKDVGQTYP